MQKSDDITLVGDSNIVAYGVPEIYMKKRKLKKGKIK